MNKDFSNRLRSSHVSPLTFHAFSLAEMLVVLLIMSIVLAMTMPIISKRAKYKAAAALNVTLPVATAGNSCSANAIGIASDGTLLTCQGGTWKKPPSGGAGQTLYIYGDNFPGYTQEPPSCPSGWTDAGGGGGNGYGGTSGGTVGSYNTITRSCYNTTQTCSTLYIYGENFPGYTQEPPSCPSGWTDAGGGGGNGYGGTSGGAVGTYNVITRSCYKCS